MISGQSLGLYNTDLLDCVSLMLLSGNFSGLCLTRLSCVGVFFVFLFLFVMFWFRFLFSPFFAASICVNKRLPFQF